MKGIASQGHSGARELALRSRACAWHALGSILALQHVLALCSTSNGPDGPIFSEPLKSGYIFVLVWLFFSFLRGPHLCSRLLLTLHLEIALAQETIWGAENRIRLNPMRDKFLTHYTISPETIRIDFCYVSVQL